VLAGDAVHDRDLACRTAERERGDAQPNAQSLGEAYAVAERDACRISNR
jgi:hypothetical protein